MNAATAHDTREAAPANRAASGPAISQLAPIIEPSEKAVRAKGPTRLFSLRRVPRSTGMVAVGMTSVAVDMASPR